MAIVKVIAELLLFVIQWIKGSKESPIQRELDRTLERLRMLEDAASKDRARRLQELDEKAAAIERAGDRAAADELLGSVTRSGDPDTN